MRRSTRSVTLLVVLLCCAGVLAAACESAPDGDGAPLPSAVAADAAATPLSEAVAAGGARLWRDNCMRCHNLRYASERSDADWTALVQHMRVRANLTGEEARLILQFLKAAN